MVERAEDAALQEREEGLGEVGVHDAAHVLMVGVVDRRVPGELAVEPAIGRMLVRQNMAHTRHVVADDPLQPDRLGVRYVEGPRLALAVD